jgi:hypothetical protein
MKARMFAISVLIVASALVSCSGGISGSQTTTQPGLSSTDPWKFYVLGLQSKPTDRPGWQEVTIDLAVENITSTPAWFPKSFATNGGNNPGNAELVDTGGYSRDGSAVNLDPRVNYYGDKDLERGFIFWPNFRVRFGFLSQIPTNQALAKLTLKLGGRSYPLDLQKPTPNVKTPFEANPNWKAKQTGESLEIPKDIRATITRATIVDANSVERYQGYSRYEGIATFVITGDLENTGGYDYYLQGAGRAYAFDSTGRLFAGEIASYGGVAPGLAGKIEAHALSDFPLASVQSGWFVLCLLPNPANKQSTQTDKCEIYQLSK